MGELSFDFKNESQSKDYEQKAMGPTRAIQMITRESLENDCVQSKLLS